MSTCVIIEISEADEWPDLDMGYGRLAQHPRAIPQVRRPSCLQPDREMAETEAKRLARMHPTKRFAILEVVAVASTIEVPSHVTISGRVVQTRREAAIALIGDKDMDIPF